MEEVNVTAVKLDTAPAEASLKSLRNELKALKDEMAGLEEGSDAFLECANKAGTLKHQIDEINESVKGASSDFGDMLGNVSKVATGIIGGFQAAQGALTLFGVESEEVTKAIQKMQASMAIVQGLNSIDQGIKALDKLRNSIISTTAAAKVLKAVLTPKVILALTVAVSALTAGIKKLFENSKKLHEAEVARYEAYKQAQLDKRAEEEKKIADALEEQYQLNEKIYKIRFGGNDVKVYTALLADYQQELEGVNAALKDQYNDTEKLAAKGQLRQLETELKGLTEGSSEYYNKLLEITHQETVVNSIRPKSAEEIEKLTKRQKELTDKIDQTNNSLREAQIIEQEMKNTDSEKKKNADEYTKSLAEAYQLRILQAKVTYKDEKELNKQLVIIEKERLNDFKEGSKEYLEQQLKIRDAEKKLVTGKYDDELTQLENVHTEEIAKLQLQLYNKEITLEQFNERAKELNDAYKQDYIDTLQFLLESDTITAEQREEIYKKLNDATKPESKEEETKDPLILELYSVQDALADLASSDSWGIIMKNMGNLAVKMADVGKQIKQNGKQDWTAYAQIAAYALSMVGSSLSQLAAQEDATDKEGFERKKKLEISGAVMNMLGGIVGAVSSAMNPANAWMTAPGQIAMATVMSALIAGVGAAQIASIAKQQMGNIDTGTSTASTSSSAVNTAIIAPVQYTSDVQGANIESAIKDTKVYVTETDISRVQNKVSVAESESRY